MKNKNLLYFIIVVLILFTVGCSSSKETLESEFNVKILPRSSWDANQPKPFKTQIPERITIHHEGEYFSPDSNAAKFIKKIQVWGMSEARNWTDIPYHFLIGLDGKIYEGRNVFTTGETATDYNPQGHLLISCIGNFEEQPLPKAQLNALINLIAYCCEKYQISPETIKAHKDYAETLCPGKNLYKYVKDGYIKTYVEDLLK